MAQAPDFVPWQTTFPLCPGRPASAAVSTYTSKQEDAENSAPAVLGGHKSEVRMGQSVLK